ncbi:MAG: MaoC family dehydratase N-terminal domain-containing protein [Candidatus Competibacteraceae bacterium]|nr:MaoC family dehydratase N-terminal domain-containing protein [Candidatus Competibacteraceae bacterium]
MNNINLQDWVGKTEEVNDHLYPTPVRALAATLDDPHLDVAQGAPLPEIWHWLYFLPMTPRSGIAADGHAKRGGFLPPVTLERRMWASGQLTFHQDLRIGDAVVKTSEILKVSEKTGKTGGMVFVTVKHSIRSERGLAVEEEQNIVYLPMPKVFTPAPPNPAPADLSWKDAYPMDPILLFRFSALTFNAHRIHYDIHYVTEVEKYPGIVVHGPLQALLLLGSACKHHPDRKPAHYAYRAVRPLFDFDQLYLGGQLRTDDSHDLYAINTEGNITMQATVSWR